MIEVLKVSIDQADHKKQLLKNDYDRQKLKLHQDLEAKIKKREDLDRHVEVLRKDLERLNTMRNNLYADIGNEERSLKDKENEKTRLIV